MAIFRQIYMSFWSDPKVDDDFTPEDKFFYLYLLTNPHTNLCGCYEISMRQMERETGYNTDTIRRLIDRMEKEHGVLRYSKSTKEILLVNWYKYNWSSSEKFARGVADAASGIKSAKFRNYVYARLKDAFGDRVSIPYGYPIDTLSLSPVTVTDTDTVSDTVTDTSTDAVSAEEEILDPVINLLLHDGSEFPITEQMVNEWAELYPAVDIVQELRKMRGWCIANRKKRKTRSGILRFVTSWLAREQDRGGTRYPAAHNVRNAPNSTMDDLRELHDLFPEDDP